MCVPGGGTLPLLLLEGSVEVVAAMFHSKVAHIAVAHAVMWEWPSTYAYLPQCCSRAGSVLCIFLGQAWLT